MCHLLNVMFLFIVFICKSMNFHEKKDCSWYQLKSNLHLYVDWCLLQNFRFVKKYTLVLKVFYFECSFRLGCLL